MARDHAFLSSERGGKGEKGGNSHTPCESVSDSFCIAVQIPPFAPLAPPRCPILRPATERGFFSPAPSSTPTSASRYRLERPERPAAARLQQGCGNPYGLSCQALLRRLQAVIVDTGRECAGSTARSRPFHGKITLRFCTITPCLPQGSAWITSRSHHGRTRYSYMSIARPDAIFSASLQNWGIRTRCTYLCIAPHHPR